MKQNYSDHRMKIENSQNENFCDWLYLNAWNCKQEINGNFCFIYFIGWTSRMIYNAVFIKFCCARSLVNFQSTIYIIRVIPSDEHRRRAETSNKFLYDIFNFAGHLTSFAFSVSCRARSCIGYFMLVFVVVIPVHHQRIIKKLRANFRSVYTTNRILIDVKIRLFPF